jgi:hypothetical protein
MVVLQGKVTKAIDVVQWAVSGDDDKAASETRKRARQCGPDAVAFLNFVLRTDKFASPAQRVRATIALLEVGEFLSSEAKPTGLFRVEDSDGRLREDAGSVSSAARAFRPCPLFNAEV